MINELIGDWSFGFEIRGREVGELGYDFYLVNETFLGFHPYIFHINSPEGWNPSTFDRTPLLEGKFEFEFGFFLRMRQLIHVCINQNLITN